jgi:oligopeptide transport system substrate-binding protein
MVDDVQTLDPAHVSSATDAPYVQEVFSGLYKFDNHNKIVADLATALPDVSSDGKTYTITLTKNARFSNGDPLNSKDVLYSWNRAARVNDAYASIFDPVVGGPDVEAGKALSMSGLTAPDDRTVKVQLSTSAGYFLNAIALPVAAWIVDQRVVQSAGEDTWATRPETLIGSGPFKMTARIAKTMMEFAPVSKWWGGSTGVIRKIHVDVGVDQTASLKKFEAGGYSIVGYAAQPPATEDVLRYRSDLSKSKLLTLYSSGSTTWLGFNFTRGPFAPRPRIKPGDSGRDGRLAFSRAIDRDQLVDVACGKGTTCTKASGGFIAKGLKGYLGDNRDPTSKFDAAGAKATYKKWDPDGSKVSGLQLHYNADAFDTQYFSNVQAQLQSNLGVKVELAPSDLPTLIGDTKAKEAILFRQTWIADYDNPQDWFDNLWTCAQAPVGKGNGSGYCNPAMDHMVQAADAKPVDQAVPAYQKAERMMIEDVYGAALTYGVQPYIVQPHVKGAGYTGLLDYRWEGMRS